MVSLNFLKKKKTEFPESKIKSDVDLPTGLPDISPKPLEPPKQQGTLPKPFEPSPPITPEIPNKNNELINQRLNSIEHRLEILTVQLKRIEQRIINIEKIALESQNES